MVQRSYLQNRTRVADEEKHGYQGDKGAVNQETGIDLYTLLQARILEWVAISFSTAMAVMHKAIRCYLP